MKSFGITAWETVNTSFDAIDKLTTKATYLELEVVDYKKQMATAVKANGAKKSSDLLTDQAIDQA